jgi:hypothetical protein
MVNSVKSSEPQASIDRVFAQPKPTELRTTHHPMLLRRQPRDPRISKPSLR